MWLKKNGSYSISCRTACNFSQIIVEASFRGRRDDMGWNPAEWGFVRMPLQQRERVEASQHISLSGKLRKFRQT